MQKRKIYFAGSIRGGREDASLYQQIISELTKYGEVLTEHVGADGLPELGESHLPDQAIHDRDIAWIRAADIMIAEVSTPSLGVGYEIATAGHLGKIIYCLFKKQSDKELSAMIRGSSHVSIREYASIDEVKILLKEIFERPHQE